jgi:alpha-beta hydrolase superfamily lysophospholipase
VRRTAAFVALVATALGSAAAPSAAIGDEVVERPVAFEVRNTNSSGFACSSDGASYTVRGHLTGPRSALDAAGRNAVTLYLYGWEGGEWNWRFRAVPGYNHALALARLGHVSLTIDLPGYDSSGHPPGFAVCLGSWADVTHQVIEALRSGRYAVAAGRPPAFEQVVLAGHDIGGSVAQIEAYSYQDIDGLVVASWADQGFTQFVLRLATDANARCGAGGEEAEPGAPGGYVYFVPDERDFRTMLFADPDPRVVDASFELRNRNPCGGIASGPPSAATNPRRLAAVRVPVLVTWGAQETGWTREGFEQQQRHFTGSDDVSAAPIDGSGHFPMLERAAPAFHAAIAGWLRSRALLSAGAVTADGCPAANRPIPGGPGPDRLIGSAGDEHLTGSRGHDRLSGGGGADCVIAGPGDDGLSGGAGDDLLVGGPGADRVLGGRGRDVVSGGPGGDRVDVVDGERDSVRCGKGADRVRADRADRVAGCERVLRPPTSYP